MPQESRPSSARRPVAGARVELVELHGWIRTTTDEDGWFATGDRGRLDAAGRLHVLGRRRDRIVTGGENVDPVEVEQALEGLPSVAAACVFGVPDREWGEVVSAAVVKAPGAAPEAVANGVRALRTLAAFKRPRRLALVDGLPRNATGKLDRAAVERLATPLLRPLD